MQRNERSIDKSYQRNTWHRSGASAHLARVFQSIQKTCIASHESGQAAQDDLRSCPESLIGSLGRYKDEVRSQEASRQGRYMRLTCMKRSNTSLMDLRAYRTINGLDVGFLLPYVRFFAAGCILARGYEASYPQKAWCHLGNLHA